MNIVFDIIVFSRRGKSKGYEVLDLVEQGFTASAQYLQGLLDFESEFRSRPDNVAESNNWPTLSSEKPLLEIVASGLREAEHARRNGKLLFFFFFCAYIIKKMVPHDTVTFLRTRNTLN